jgi:hypothetical protein
MHTVPECAACYRITITSCHMIGLSISQKEKKVKTTENMNPSRKSYWNNEMHFGKTNGTMPQVHSRFCCCSTIAISNNGMYLANASIAAVAAMPRNVAASLRSDPPLQASG